MDGLIGMLCWTARLDCERVYWPSFTQAPYKIGREHDRCYKSLKLQKMSASLTDSWVAAAGGWVVLLVDDVNAGAPCMAVDF